MAPSSPISSSFTDTFNIEGLWEVPRRDGSIELHYVYREGRYYVTDDQCTIISHGDGHFTMVYRGSHIYDGYMTPRNDMIKWIRDQSISAGVLNRA